MFPWPFSARSWHGEDPAQRQAILDKLGAKGHERDDASFQQRRIQDDLYSKLQFDCFSKGTKSMTPKFLPVPENFAHPTNDFYDSDPKGDRLLGAKTDSQKGHAQKLQRVLENESAVGALSKKSIFDFDGSFRPLC
jgi:hypothetical protein